MKTTKNKRITTQIDLSSIAPISEELKRFIYAGSQPFIFHLRDFGGDFIYGLIDIEELKEYLEEEEGKIIEELQKLYDLAKIEEIKEIIFR
jgi:hypothetical protein